VIAVSGAGGQRDQQPKKKATQQWSAVVDFAAIGASSDEGGEKTRGMSDFAPRCFGLSPIARETAAGRISRGACGRYSGDRSATSEDGLASFGWRIFALRCRGFEIRNRMWRRADGTTISEYELVFDPEKDAR